MRYAYGILFGFILPGIIFIGSAIIKAAGYGITDAAILSGIWGLFLVWTVVSIAILFVPVIIFYYARRDEFREYLIFHLGGFSLFTPFWFSLATELSGDSFIETFLNGIENSLPFFNEVGGISGINIGPIILIPSMLALMIIGLVVLRPSFIEIHSTTREKPRRDKKKKRPAIDTESPTEAMEAEMPDVTPPVPDKSSVEELRGLLTELGVPQPTIDAILSSGIATVTDLVATSAEQIAKMASIDAKTAQEIHLAVQKKVWFGGI